MNEMLLPVTAATLAAGAVLVLALAFVRHREHAGVRRSLDLVIRTGASRSIDAPTVPNSGVLRPMFESVARAVVLPANRRSIKATLVKAGQLGDDAVQRVLDQKLLWGSVGAVVGVLWIVRFGAWGWLILPLAMGVGYFAPDLASYNAGLKRTEQIRLQLPDALDLLDLCVESGLSLQAGMAKVAEVQSGPVAEEFARVLQEMRLGVPRTDALQALADRAAQKDLRQLVSAIIQAESLGIPIAGVLKEQAKEMRSKRSDRARELAQKVPVKILAPLMLCFLPGLFIIILGPAAITAVDVFLRN